MSEPHYYNPKDNPRPKKNWTVCTYKIPVTSSKHNVVVSIANYPHDYACLA